VTAFSGNLDATLPAIRATYVPDLGLYALYGTDTTAKVYRIDATTGARAAQGSTDIQPTSNVIGCGLALVPKAAVVACPNTAGNGYFAAFDPSTLTKLGVDFVPPATSTMTAIRGATSDGRHIVVLEADRANFIDYEDPSAPALSRVQLLTVGGETSSSISMNYVVFDGVDFFATTNFGTNALARF
jgi:hypothetical protein